ncbi:MAG: hypothetical protein ACI35R_08545 [Bacillus sp. (in: firmicutes)]
MKKNNIKLLIVMSVLLLFGAACSANIEEEKMTAIDSAKNIFMKGSQEPNKKSGDTSFFMPSGYEIKKSEEYNILLEKQDNPVIIFINPNEADDSDLISRQIEKNKDEYIAFDIFEEQNRVGFVTIKEISEEEYEITTGVGGVKVTAQTEVEQLSEYAEEMMRIATSIKQ